MLLNLLIPEIDAQEVTFIDKEQHDEEVLVFGSGKDDLEDIVVQELSVAPRSGRLHKPMEKISDPSEGKAGPKSFPAGLLTQGPAGTKMRRTAETIDIKPAPGLQLFTFFIEIMRFLPYYRKKHAKRKNNSYRQK